MPDKIHELVQRFYSHLMEEEYFRTKFEERNVNIDDLKKKQVVFISRLIYDDTPEDEQAKLQQIQNRHRFQTNPEQGKIWLDIMKKTIDEVHFSQEVKDSLKAKMDFFINGIKKTEPQ